MELHNTRRRIDIKEYMYAHGKNRHTYFYGKLNLKTWTDNLKKS